MHGTVPLARRNTLADPRRLAASAVAVGLAISLILLLDGLWTGITRGVTAYEDNVGADLYVAQPGTHNFFGAFRQLDAMVTDPACATSIQPDDTTPHYQFGGTTHWFCSTACRDDFAAEPGRYRTHPGCTIDSAVSNALRDGQ
jgi:YHS domain-containing protein